ncbi:MAG: sirohydrochlorin cobaltochelatase [Pelosinus sp.]|nr:sirohydrochlorin cobaltochelatase [Pelosinus sp.]
MNRKKICVLVGVLMFCFGMVNITPEAQAAQADKKAILVVSFGTTFADTRAVTTDAVADKIKEVFPEYEVRQAFTSRIIIKKLMERDGLNFDTEKQALEKLKDEGYSEVVVQPLHIEAGDEYEKVSKVVEEYKESGVFDKIVLGRPILYFMGQEARPDDYAAAIDALKSQLPSINKDQAIAIMGHGGAHPSNAAYGTLQLKLQDAKMDNVFVFTVEGYPSFEQLVEKLKANSIKKVYMLPFLLVAGSHANNDMAGADKESFKSRLEAAGFQVEAYMHGLGENAGIQNIYVQHVRDAIDGAYDKSKRAKDRPVIPVIE